jgi:hypothetical protein
MSALGDIADRWVSGGRLRWEVFCYNFRWSNYSRLLDGWLSKAAMAVPFVGYLILFNDSVANRISFNALTNAEGGYFELSSSARLKFVYLGLVCLGAANIVYVIRRPYVLKLGRDEPEYVEHALKHFTLADYIQLNGDIRGRGIDPYTQHGKYYTAEYEGFVQYASHPSGPNPTGKKEDPFHWADAKNKYENLLRSMLKETYFRESVGRQYSLIACLSIALIGYLLLLIPSTDLFLRVMSVIVLPLIGR